MTAYATTADLESFWRPLNGTTEPDRAEKLLDMAGVIIRAHCGGEPADADAAAFVSLDMVKNAMLPGTDALPVRNLQMSGGPYSQSVTFANPSGDLYWKGSYDELLGTSGLSVSTVRARSVFDE